jgi:D-cysteine desulfhydrase family pyridoxal phosphate-dependent enzyme
MNLPRVRFAILPTPVEILSRLSAELGGPVIYCKRDDQTGLAMGGNKARKLEFVLAEAQANGAKTLITVGAIQSNHCRQTAAMAAKFGFKCVVVLSGDEPESKNGNLLLDDLFGAKIVWTTKEKREAVLKETFNASWQNGERPFLIPLGASNAVGTLGYVEAMKELKEQGGDFDWIITASSSGGTQAGMVLGAKIYDLKAKILGISIDHPTDELQKTVSALVNEAANRLGISISVEPGEIRCNADYLGGGYGIMGDLEKNAIRLFAQKEGLLLDPVYTARAAGAIIDLIKKGFFNHPGKILFWHTGGTPALFAESYAEYLTK